MGNGFYYFNEAETGWVGNIVSVANVERIGITDIPFMLDTGDHKVAFTVNGQIKAVVLPGEGFIEKLPRSARASPPRIVAVKGPGWAGRVGGLRPESGAKLAIAADGAVWMKYFAPGREPSAPAEWARAATAPGGPVTLVLDGEDRPVLLALDEQGDAMAWQVNGDTGMWIRLGAKLTGAISAVERREGRLDLFGVDAKGYARHRVFDPREPEPADWRQIGGGIVGELTALAHQAGTALFAVDREGQMIHALARGDETPSWQRIGGPPVDWFSAAALVQDIGGILVSALTKDRILHVLHWRDFPRGRPQRLWHEKGSIDEIVPMAPINPPTEPDGERSAPKSSDRQRKR